MPQITISVKNAKLVQKGLSNIRAEIPRISANTIKKVAEKIVKRMRDYPPERPGQKYVRTFRLRDSFKISSTSTGFTVKANPTSPRGKKYGRYVIGTFDGGIGNGGQAWMHVGRWLLFRDVAEYEVSLLPPAVEEHIRMKIKQQGL